MPSQPCGTPFGWVCGPNLIYLPNNLGVDEGMYLHRFGQTSDGRSPAGLFARNLSRMSGVLQDQKSVDLIPRVVLALLVKKGKFLSAGRARCQVPELRRKLDARLKNVKRLLRRLPRVPIRNRALRCSDDVMMFCTRAGTISPCRSRL